MNEEVTLFAGLGVLLLIVLAFFKMKESVNFSDALTTVFIVTVFGIGGLIIFSLLKR